MLNQITKLAANTPMRFLAAACILSIFTLSATHSAVAKAKEDPLILTKQWETEGFVEPESVLAIPGHDWLYVSNVNGKEAGFVSRIGRDGKIDTLKWVEGITTATGMGFHDGKIYVADQTQVQVIELESGKLLAAVPATEAKTLNDIAISADGQVFISDLTSGSIHTIDGDKVVPWTKSAEFPFPNGLEIQGDSLIVGNIGTVLKRDLKPDEYGALYRVSLADKSVELIEPTLKGGAFDGVVTYKGGILASNPFNGELLHVKQGKKAVVLKAEGGLADIGIDTEQGVVYAPLLFAGKVAAYKMAEAEPWTRLTTKDEFLAKVADKYFGDEGGQSVASSAGKISGNFGGKELTGNWEWKGGYFCRDSQLGDIEIGMGCLVIEVTDTKMRLMLQKGAGPSIVYDKK